MQSVFIPYELADVERTIRLIAEAEVAELKNKVKTLEDENAALKDTVKLLGEKIEQLELEVSKSKRNSNNSNKPPSTDGYAKPVVKNSRTKSEKKSGGQKGHEGATLKFQADVDYIVELIPIETCECGGKIIVETENYTIRQVIEIQTPKKIVIEYHQYSGVCDRCGKVYKGVFPDKADNTVVYGPKLKAFLTYLTQYQLIPIKRTTELVKDFFGLHISQGTVVSANKEAAEKLEGFEDYAKEKLIHSDVAHFDESGLRVNGELKWLHVVCTLEITLYYVHKNRGRVAMDEMGVLPNFTGTAVHDHWKSYYVYLLCAHAECNAHHIRHLQYLHEDLGYQWAGEMICLLLRIKTHVDLSKIFGVENIEMEEIKGYENIYNRIIESAKEEEAARINTDTTYSDNKRKKSESERMYSRMSEYRIETLTFMYDFSIPFDNNLAERDIRMPKAKQKISGCFRTDEGAEAFARTRGFISTVVKCGKSVIDSLVAVFNGNATKFLGWQD